MSSATLSPDEQSVLAALQSLYSDPDANAKQQANDALLRFQKTPQAWSTANTLLLSPKLPLEARMFAAQTFRAKVTFDLEQLPMEAQLQLRDTLLHALEQSASGPRVVQTQLCLALAALALQMPEAHWSRVVPGMIEKFGQSPLTVGVLLEFLTVLPEEVSTNHRIPVDNTAYHERVPQLLTEHSDTVLQVLVMYMQADGITTAIQATVFSCLRSWLKTGEVSARQLAHTPLLDCAFHALASEELFDVAVDVVCDLINETQEIEENTDVVERLLPQITALRVMLDAAGDDEDKVRGLCRIFVQAGETYHMLCLQHGDAMQPIVKAILDCASYHDLDIVQITFRFWYLLASDVHRAAEQGLPSAEPYRALYEQLFAVILRHLRFPDDDNALTGQERDDFRSFRHYMGDTLKDCCYVLGAEVCIERSLKLIDEALAQPESQIHWQDMESPLFSMRSMGGQIDLRDSVVIPRVFAVVPRLPPHPRLRYAGLLVMSRYTEWIAEHPDHVGDVFAFITASFEGADKDIAAAGAQALNFLCQDCHEHMLPYFPQLLDFFCTMRDTLSVDDMLALSEAIAHVISAMSPQDAAPALLLVAQPLLEGVHTVTTLPAAGKSELMRAADRMEQLARILQVIGVSLTSTLPAQCASTCSEAYAVLDRLLERHGDVYFISERASALVRRALLFFGRCAEPSLPALLERFATCFEATGYSGYVWIIGKSIDQFAGGADATLNAQLTQAFQRVTQKVTLLLAESPSPDAVSDVLDDYLHTCLVTLNSAGEILWSPSTLPAVYATAIRAMTAMLPNVVGIAADVVRAVTESTPPPAQADVLQGVLQEQGDDVCRVMVQGLVTHFPPENMPVVIATLQTLGTRLPSALPTWLQSAAQTLPTDAVPETDRAQFLEMWHNGSSMDRLKPSLVMLYGASRKSRERGTCFHSLSSS